MASPIKLVGRDDEDAAEVVALLKDLLAAAERGEILSLITVAERPGGVVSFNSTRVRDRYTLLGHLTHQAWIVNQSLEDDSEPSTLREQ